MNLCVTRLRSAYLYSLALVAALASLPPSPAVAHQPNGLSQATLPQSACSAHQRSNRIRGATTAGGATLRNRPPRKRLSIGKPSLPAHCHLRALSGKLPGIDLLRHPPRMHDQRARSLDCLNLRARHRVDRILAHASHGARASAIVSHRFTALRFRFSNDGQAYALSSLIGSSHRHRRLGEPLADRGGTFLRRMSW